LGCRAIGRMEQYLGMSIKHEAPHCATSSILLLLLPSLVQIFSLGPCSQTPSVYAFFLRTFLTAEVFLNHSGFLDHVQSTHTLGLLWTSDQPVAEAHRTTQHRNTRDKHPCSQLDPNPRPQQPSCRRPTPYTARPLRSASMLLTKLN
jgi:hypothetical protein